jgi:hypothetical protein
MAKPRQPFLSLARQVREESRLEQVRQIVRAVEASGREATAAVVSRESTLPHYTVRRLLDRLKAEAVPRVVAKPASAARDGRANIPARRGDREAGLLGSLINMLDEVDRDEAARHVRFLADRFGVVPKLGLRTA